MKKQVSVAPMLVITMWLLWVALWVSVVFGVFFVAVHFLSKLW